MKEHREQRSAHQISLDALLTTKMQGKVNKHTDPDAQFVPSSAAKHRVPKKFSNKNPTQKYKDQQVRTLEPTRLEEISSDEEDENKADVS